jgi:Protein of unknown function (DUF1579)
MQMSNSEAQQQPSPDPALRRLDRLVGRWSVKGRLIGSDEENIVGEISFQWLAGGFFLQQDAEIDFAGMFKVNARELIGHDPKTGRFASYVYSNFSPTPLPYQWELREDTLTIFSVAWFAGRNLPRRIQPRRRQLLWWLAAKPWRGRNDQLPL